MMTSARPRPAKKYVAVEWRELLLSEVLPGVDSDGGRRLGAGEGKIYFNARYYDPTAGRFLTEDPARKGVNWYAYCGNNPVNKTDPTGKEGGFFENVWNSVKSVVTSVWNFLNTPIKMPEPPMSLSSNPLGGMFAGVPIELAPEPFGTLAGAWDIAAPIVGAPSSGDIALKGFEGAYGLAAAAASTGLSERVTAGIAEGISQAYFGPFQY